MISPGYSKESKYKHICNEIQKLVRYSLSPYELRRSVVEMLAGEMNFLWIGFYWVKGEYLFLDVYKGPDACERIAYGKGVCGTAWKRAESLNVPDVDAFPGHIACSSLSRSEAVIPVFQEGEVVGVLDIDSECTAYFDDTDMWGLQKIVRLITAGAV